MSSKQKKIDASTPLLTLPVVVYTQLVLTDQLLLQSADTLLALFGNSFKLQPSIAPFFYIVTNGNFVLFEGIAGVLQ